MKTHRMDSLELLRISKELDDNSWLSYGWMEGTCLSLESRAGIIDWLIQVQQYLGLTETCLHSAVANFDAALARLDWDQGEVQLLALAALQAAAKMEEDCPPAPSMLLPLAGDVYTKGDLARIELELMGVLDWSVRQTTASTFLTLLADIVGKGRKPVLRMAKAILDLCLYQDWYGCEQPSYLAACCLAAASSLCGQPWCEQLIGVTGHTWAGLSDGIRLCLVACTTAQAEGFSEKHGKCGRNLLRLRDGIKSMVSGEIRPSMASAGIA